MKNIKFFLPLFALLSFTFFQCAKETSEPVPSSVDATSTEVATDRDAIDNGTSNFAVTYKINGQNTTEQAYNALPESAYKHAIVSPALATEPADLLHIEVVAFSTRPAYEVWGDTKGYKIRESLLVEDQLTTAASNAGLTDASAVPQWYTDYASNLISQQLNPPSPCYLGVTLWDLPIKPPFPQIDPSIFLSSTQQGLPISFFHKASSAKFHKLSLCGNTIGHMKAFKDLFGTQKIMTLSVTAGSPRFTFVGILAPLNNNIGSLFHWGTF
jgi:hypothetical protein